MRGHRDDGNMGQPGFDGANRSSRLATIHFRHRDIHEDHVGAEAVKQFHRLAPVIGKHQFDVGVFDHLLEHQLIGAIVFGSQDPHGAAVLQIGQHQRRQRFFLWHAA